MQLTLDRFVRADAPAFATYRSDPETARYQGWTAPYELASALALIEAQIDRTSPENGEWLQMALRLGSELVGDVAVGMSSDGRVADIGYTLGPAFRSRGFAVEAVGALVDRLFACTDVAELRASLDPRNQSSARVVERIGFRYRGSYEQPPTDPEALAIDGLYTINRDERAAWMARPLDRPRLVRLVEITPENARSVRTLEVHGSQRHLVADVVASLADAQVPELVDGEPVVPWYRAIEADGQLVGFIMIAEQTEAHAEAYLWRLLIDRAHQRRSIGEAAIALVVDRLRGLGQTSLLTSWVPGAGSPEPFYLRLGFVPTGRSEGDEIEARLTLQFTK
jgi:RimJ/RimL family protein N-acetyltransferase